jgi:hypothetical protein
MKLYPRTVQIGSDGKRKTQCYVFRLRYLGHHGRHLRFSNPDEDGYITVMKGAKRDAECEITMLVYNAT